MAGIYNAAGTRLTKAGVTLGTISDPEVKVDVDLYRRRPWGVGDKVPEGSLQTLLLKAGAVIRQSELDALFPAGTVTSISPTSGGTAGGTVVTITGKDLDGVSSVTFGGTAGTSLTVVSRTEVQVTTPAKVAGSHAVVVVDDGNNIAAGNFTTA